MTCPRCHNAIASRTDIAAEIGRSLNLHYAAKREGDPDRAAAILYRALCRTDLELRGLCRTCATVERVARELSSESKAVLQ